MGKLIRFNCISDNVDKVKVVLGRASVPNLGRGGVRQLPEDDIKATGGCPILVNV